MELARTCADATVPKVLETEAGGYRMVVAHDPLVAAEQTAQRRARIAAIEARAQADVDKLTRQDEGKKARAAPATAYLRSSRREGRIVEDPQPTCAPTPAAPDDAALARQEAFDGKLILLTTCVT
ncbi:MAG: hypothetical protein IPK27_08265 [Rhodanobacteraceae bacterium]|nr:hypothetical protein [Rhodanobacteraceae bacterium]